MSCSSDSVASYCPAVVDLPMPAFQALHYFQPTLPTPSDAVRFIKQGSLRVQNDIGAGLRLSLCRNGVYVEEIENTPGQPDLEVDDVITAIDGSILFDLDPERLEERFAAAFQDAAKLIIVANRHLSELQMEDVRQATQQMLRNVASHQQGNTELIFENTGSVPLGLCSHDADDGVCVTDDGCAAACVTQNEKHWSGVRGSIGVCNGMYQYEVEIQDACLLRVGFASIKSRRNIGRDERSFGYGGTAMKSTGGTFESYGSKFGDNIGDVVTCLLDRRDVENQTISFCLNGVDQGVAFKIPPKMADIPLFPTLCGRGNWRAICRYKSLRFPAFGYEPLSKALDMGHAVAGLKAQPKPPCGITVQEAHRKVQPGQRVGLYVVSGRWEGWHTCEVLDTDALGCYLRHEEDDFTETIPWVFLGKGYRMTVLSGGSKNVDDAPQTCKLQDARDQFFRLKSLLFNVANQLPEDILQVIDAKLNSRQRAFIMWLTSKDAKDRPELQTSDKGLAGSWELKEWLEALQLTQHTSIIDGWCDEQGAISLDEVIENLADLITDLDTSLSTSDCSQLLSPLAIETAQMVTLRSQSAELARLLDVALLELERDSFDVILSNLSSEQQTQLMAVQQRLSGRSPLCNATDCCAKLLLNRSRVIGSSAANISKRDEKLLRSLGDLAQVLERCEGCGQDTKASEGTLCSDDGCFYCDVCWRDWIRSGEDTKVLDVVSSLAVRRKSFSEGGA